MTEKVASLSRQLQQVGTAAFVRACARQDGVTLPEEFTGRRTIPQAFSSCCKAPTAGPRTGGSPAEEPSETALIPMQASTPSRCFWTAWRWMTVWCST